jgi:hypothetical protein
MSGMEITKTEDKRMHESRHMIMKAMNVALGSYIEQEATKKDQWRDQDYWTLRNHLAHEMDEIRRSKLKTIKIHNLMDACSLSAILLAKVLESDY